MKSLFLFFLVCLTASADNGTINPFKYIDSCQLDLDSNKLTDLVFLAETVNGRELIILLNSKKGYKAYNIKAGEYMLLACRTGKTVAESAVFNDNENSKRKTFKTKGAFLELYQPEGAAAAYFWSKNKFKEVWTAD